MRLELIDWWASKLRDFLMADLRAMMKRQRKTMAVDDCRQDKSKLLGRGSTQQRRKEGAACREGVPARVVAGTT